MVLHLQIGIGMPTMATSVRESAAYKNERSENLV
jgi:hypothetical protein